jgi:hypothetical protein
MPNLNGLQTAKRIRQIDNSVIISFLTNKVDTSILTSTKKEQGLHGIGINSIKSSVDRLGGLISFDYDDGIFKLNIMVRNCLLL